MSRKDAQLADATPSVRVGPLSGIAVLRLMSPIRDARASHAGTVARGYLAPCALRLAPYASSLTPSSTRSFVERDSGANFAPKGGLAILPA